MIKTPSEVLRRRHAHQSRYPPPPRWRLVAAYARLREIAHDTDHPALRRLALRKAGEAEHLHGGRLPLSRLIATKEPRP